MAEETKIRNEWAKIISEVMKRLPKQLEYDSTNEHFGYDFASADLVFLTVREAMEDHGILPWITEVEKPAPTELRMSKSKVLYVLEATYDIALTLGGLKPDEGEAERITVFAPINSAQSSASIRTYAVKYWLRDKLLIATGEDFLDVDYEPPAQPVRAEKRTKGNPVTKIDAEWKLDRKTGELEKEGEFPDEKTEIRAFVVAINKELLPSKSIKHAEKVYEANLARMEEFGEDVAEMLEKRLTKLQERHDAVATGEAD